eukprot:jgi/Phyca11/111299/e_gw1.20.627.1
MFFICINTIGLATVGSCVCIATVAPRPPKAWAYGVVTGYTRVQQKLTGKLFVCFGDESSSVSFNPAELQDLPVPSYTLRPCFGAPVADVMPMEMRKRHSDALNHFNVILCTTKTVEDVSLQMFNSAKLFLTSRSHFRRNNPKGRVLRTGPCFCLVNLVIQMKVTVTQTVSHSQLRLLPHKDGIASVAPLLKLTLI